MIMLWIHTTLSAVLWGSIFCRAVRMSSDTTHMSIIGAMWFLGCAALLSFAAPCIWPGWQPDLITILLLTGITLVQLVTAHHWHNGVPSRFLLP